MSLCFYLKKVKQGSIYWLALDGGNLLYIGVCLKNISDLEPTVGITSLIFPIQKTKNIQIRSNPK
jgi:hypothetical protein